MGGMEKLLVEFARNTNHDDAHLRFLTLGDRGVLADDIEACGWPVTALNAPPGLRPSLIWDLARLFRRWNVDIVHTHNTNPLIYAVPAARLAGVSGVIHTRHGQRHGAQWRINALFRGAARFVDRFVCVSDDAAALTRNEGVAPHKIRRIWNGIDVNQFAYQGPRSDGPAVMVGRLSPEKDVATLIQAVAQVVRDAPNFRLEIAGNGPCYTLLQQQVDDLGLNAHVRLLGEVRDVPALLSRASLFVLPSLTEGISLTLLEAMARGLPVITTRAGGNPEVVVDRQVGFLVPTHDPNDLANAILKVARDPELGRRLGLAGRQRVVQHFEVGRMIEDYKALYLEILQRDRLSLNWFKARASMPAYPKSII